MQAQIRASMKVVVVSDIHGNLEALTSIPEKFDELWVLGDLVNYGPDPGPVIDFIQANANVVVRGNHDHAIGCNEDPRCSEPFREMAAAMKEYTRSVLSDSQKMFLAGLPLREARRIGETRLVCCHATPSQPLFAYCPPDSPRWQQEVEDLDADLLLVGHTHIPFVREIGLKKVANPGSLGQPKIGRPEACYAVWNDGTIELRSYPYPFEVTIRKIESLPVPTRVKADLAAVLRNGGLLRTGTDGDLLIANTPGGNGCVS